MPEFKDFAALVQHLIDTRHDGMPYHMAKKLKVSAGTITMWKDGTIRRPSDPYLDKLIKAYDLDYWTVIGIISGRKPPRRPVPIAGGSDHDSRVMSSTTTGKNAQDPEGVAVSSGMSPMLLIRSSRRHDMRMIRRAVLSFPTSISGWQRAA